GGIKDATRWLTGSAWRKRLIRRVAMSIFDGSSQDILRAEHERRGRPPWGATRLDAAAAERAGRLEISASRRDRLALAGALVEVGAIFACGLGAIFYGTAL